MVAHRDTYFPKALESAGHPFLQVMMLLSTKGVDFHTGGGYIVNRSDQKSFSRMKILSARWFVSMAASSTAWKMSTWIRLSIFRNNPAESRHS